METCVVETGLLKKKPCGGAAITKCANCEIPLCAQHAVPVLNEAQKKTGKFMCKECSAAHKEAEKTHAAAAKAAPPKPGAAPAAGAPAGAAAKPPAPGAPTPQGAKGVEKKPDDDAPLEFTPSKPKP